MSLKNMQNGIIPLSITALMIAVTVFASSISLAQDVSASPVLPEQVRLGDITGTVVTLYYYDEETGGKGNIVPLPDNPQVVTADPAKAAPGTYTFTRVPVGKYYIEAVNDGNVYFAIMELKEGQGTGTANIAIPNWQRISGTSDDTDSVPETIPSPTSIISPTPSQMPASATKASTPGMTGAMAFMAIMMSLCIIALKRK
ncbi:hypothetical protein CUJ83_03075 [Methanocella sp. CWC-04]|uniref:Uncharacterized protein n=1 Tax=Methanooceanicella nereidis TaxID=2052831 RepID=A0AAP2RAY4_9EURY|nr:hypothetical protein [Methanocella sp. CWC-04]MCD1293978.1 hypothetical protein [Methanocella sp. CWC-04]